jgi:hypothetical protein
MAGSTGNKPYLRILPSENDPLYAIRRYFCVNPRQNPGDPPGPPILSGLFVPQLLPETILMNEPWEDGPSVPMFSPVMFEQWDYSVIYSDNSEYVEDWTSPIVAFSPVMVEPWNYNVTYTENPEYVESWSLTVGAIHTEDGSGYLRFSDPAFAIDNDTSYALPLDPPTQTTDNSFGTYYTSL